MYESFYETPKETTPPIPTLNWFHHIKLALEDADNRFISHVDAKKSSDVPLLPFYNKIYSVSDFELHGKPAPLNESFEALLHRAPDLRRSIDMSLRDTGILEATARAQCEALSHTSWIMSSLVAFLKLDGYVPSDPSLFNQMVRSIAMGIAHQANASSSYTTYFTKKRRDFYISHLPSHYPEVNRKALARAPVMSSSSLFQEEAITSLVTAANAAALVKSQQAIIALGNKSSSSRSRSPPRSPRRGNLKREGYRSPNRSPKKVHFNSKDSTPPRSGRKDKNFGK